MPSWKFQHTAEGFMEDKLEAKDGAQDALRDQWMAVQAMLTVIALMRKLGGTLHNARQTGTCHLHSPTACVWFDAAKLTISVSFTDPLSAGAARAFAVLVQNGFGGYLGQFEVGDVFMAVDNTVIVSFADKKQGDQEDSQTSST